MTPAMETASGPPDSTADASGGSRGWSAPLDVGRLAASLGSAPGVGFAILYFSFATNGIAAWTAGPQPFWLLTWVELLSAASVRALPYFLAGWALTVLPLPTPLRRGGQLAIGGLLVVHAAASTLDFLAHLYFGQRLSTGVIFVFAETNLAESGAFLSSHAGHDAWFALAFLALPAALLWLLSRLPARLANFGRLAFGTSLALAAANGLYASGHSGLTGFDPTAALVRGVASFREELGAYHSIEQNLGSDLTGVVAPAAVDERTAVLILGESTNRNHLGLYGYANPTSPRLAKLADALLVFTDVISPHSHTIPVLKKLFTFANGESTRPWHEHAMLLDVLNAAGYRTYWISNQEAYGTFGDISSAIASRADVRIFHNRGSTEQQRDGRDGELLAYLDRVLELDPAPRKFIVLHLMGTHSRYRDRYPKGFARFSEADIEAGDREFIDDTRRRTIAHYDNAVLYNDTVVADVVERVARDSNDAWVLYLSDHGEEVYDARDFFGHTEKIGNRHMIEVPFLLWLSDAYRDARPATAAALTEHRASPFMTDDLAHTVVELCDVAPPAFEAERSLASADFDPGRQRQYAGRDYDREVRFDDAPQLIARHLDKIWAHRVNSLGKLDQLASQYDGVELDLTIEQDANGQARFDVNHPPAESIGLSLDTYWSVGPTRPLRYWLDVKNLSEANANRFAAHLGKLLQRHGIARDRVVTESTEHAALAQIADADLRTSFYLPYLKLDELSQAQLERRAVELAEQAKHSRAGALSFPGYMLDYVRDRIRPRVGEVTMLTWYPQRSLANPADAPFLQEVVDDPAVEVVLVGHRTKHDR
jgi:heptose-I-phosphate ethanolaminephosphotransferase